MKKPGRSNLGDHEVPKLDSVLDGVNVALMVTGGIAAIKAPLLCRALRKSGATVTVFASEEALRYTTEEALEWCSNSKVVTKLSMKSEHLTDFAKFDLYLIAPATYSTINKFAAGIADTAITTTLAVALSRLEKGECKIAIAPTMHGDLQNSILDESVAKLEKKGVFFIPARDENGKHNLPPYDTIIDYSARLLSTSKLAGKKILLTYGPTPVRLDKVRIITNKFTGQLGVKLARQLFVSGADLVVVSSDRSIALPEHMVNFRISDYEDYKNTCLNVLKKDKYDIMIFSAAVADYQPEKQFDGKLPSQKETLTLDLVPTEKVVDLAKEVSPDSKLVSFKLEYGKSHDELFKIAKSRVARGHDLVVANLGDDFDKKGQHVAYLVSKDGVSDAIEGKNRVATAIVEKIESLI